MVKNKPLLGMYWADQHSNTAHREKIHITASEQYQAFNIANKHISRLITHLPTQPPIPLSYVNMYQLKLEIIIKGRLHVEA